MVGIHFCGACHEQYYYLQWLERWHRKGIVIKRSCTGYSDILPLAKEPVRTSASEGR